VLSFRLMVKRGPQIIVDDAGKIVREVRVASELKLSCRC